MQPLAKVIACVVVYTRQRTIDAWLRAWSWADTGGARLAVIHNFDGDGPPEDQRNNILKHRPEFYVPRRNHGQDIGAFQEVITPGFAQAPSDWEWLFWSADDTLPMRRDFLRIFLDKFTAPDIGLVGYHADNKAGETFIRTNCFCIKRQAAEGLRFPDFQSAADPSSVKRLCLSFEYGEYNLHQQVCRLGFRASAIAHWREEYGIVWDSGHLRDLDLWQEFERNLADRPGTDRSPEP